MICVLKTVPHSSLNTEVNATMALIDPVTTVTSSARKLTATTTTPSPETTNLHEKLLGGESQGHKGEGVLSIPGKFYGISYLWLLSSLLFFCFSANSLEMRSVELRGVIPQAGRPSGWGGQDRVSVLSLLSCAHRMTMRW